MEVRAVTLVLAGSLACGGATAPAASEGGSTSAAATTSSTTLATEGSSASDETNAPPCPPTSCLDVGGQPSCASASECTLVDDCCQCTAYGPRDEPPPPCPDSCEQTMCAALGIDQAACELGFHGEGCHPAVNCDATHSTCDDPPPDCPAGELPVVVDGCWGPCIPLSSCSHVTDCSACPETTLCVVYELGFDPYVVCIAIPPECPDPPTCDCFPDGLCTHATDTFCSDGPAGPECVPGFPD